MNREYLLVPIIFFLGGNASAGTMGAVYDGYQKVITVSGGVAWTSINKSQDIYLEPDLRMSFIADDRSSTLGSGEIFAGFQQSFIETISYQLGLAFSGSASAKASGSVWIFGNPEFDDYWYTYKINHTHIALKGKLLADAQFLVQPYLSGSIGVGFNRSRNFEDIPKIFEQLAFPNFQNHTQTAFTYTLGAGMQKAINPQWLVGIGYEFADWGKSRLDPCNNQLIGTGLRLNHLYTHQLQFSLSYII